MSNFLNFVNTEDKPKTKVWVVENAINQIALGKIAWWSPWRQYCFFPISETILHDECLEEVTEFIKQRNLIHKHKRKNDRSSVI